jgi:DNA-binding transcriptional MerR regulator
MKIAEVCEQYRHSSDTLRCYERIGLIQPVNRSESGIRDYGEIDLRRVEFIKCMRSAGLLIEVLIEYVGLVQQGDRTIEARKEILVEQRALLAARKPSAEQNETRRARSDDLIKSRYDRMDNAPILERVSAVAEARGLPMAQVALAWMLSKPVVTAPIIGATRPNHLEDAIAALSVQLTPEELCLLEEAYQPHPVIGFS